MGRKENRNWEETLSDPNFVPVLNDLLMNDSLYVRIVASRGLTEYHQCFSEEVLVVVDEARKSDDGRILSLGFRAYCNHCIELQRIELEQNKP